MSKPQSNQRGLSAASKAAGQYLDKHPDTSPADLAKKFKIALTTVYRSPWWKKRNEQGKTND